MMAVFTRDIGQSESGSAEGSAAVGWIARETVPTVARETLTAAAVGMARDTTPRRETILYQGSSQNSGTTGRQETGFPVDVGSRGGQPNQPGRAGE